MENESYELDPTNSFDAVVLELADFAAEYSRLASIEKHADNLTSANLLLCQEKHDLAEENAKLTDLAKHHRAEFDKLGHHHQTEIKKAEVAITRMDANIRALTDELKTLKALNPKKLVEQNKRLQSKNKELNAGLDHAKKSMGELAKLRSRNKSLELSYEKALKDLARYDAALKQACDDINNNNKPEALWEDKSSGWAIYASEKPENVVVHDSQNDASRTYFNGQGMPKIRSAPKSVQAKAQEIIDGLLKEGAELDEWRKA